MPGRDAYLDGLLGERQGTAPDYGNQQATFVHAVSAWRPML